jgi:hypothetical protein
VVDEDAVLAADPFGAGARTAPALHEIAVGIEFQHRGRRHAAIVARRLQGGAALVLGQ